MQPAQATSSTPSEGLGMHRSGSWTACRPSKAPLITLNCIIVGATDLVQRDDCNDPIVVYKVEARDEAQTPVQPNTCNPVWNYSFSCQCKRNQTLSFSVWDYNENTTDNFLGAVAFSLQDVTATPTTHSLPLTGVEKGVLKITVSCSELTNSPSVTTTASPMAPKHNKPLTTSGVLSTPAQQPQPTPAQPQPGYPTSQPSTQPGQPGYPPQPSMQPGQPGQPGYQPQPSTQPGQPGYPPQPGQPGYPPQPGQPGYPPQQSPQPGYPPQPGQPGYPPYQQPTQPGQAQPGYPYPQPGQPGYQPYPQPGQPYPQPGQPGYQPYPQPGQPGYPPYPQPGQPGYQPYPQPMVTPGGYPTPPGQVLVVTPAVTRSYVKLIPNPLTAPVEVMLCMGIVSTAGSERKFFSLDKKKKLFKAEVHIMTLTPRFELHDCTHKEIILNGKYKVSGTTQGFGLMRGETEIASVFHGRKIETCAEDKIDMKGSLLDLQSHFEFVHCKQIVVSLKREKKFSLDTHVTVPVGSDVGLALGVLTAISILSLLQHNHH